MLHWFPLPKGTFLSLKNAAPVFLFYGLKSALPKVPPGIDNPIIQSPFPYHNRAGKHNLMLYDWTSFTKFADYYFRIVR